MLTTSTAGKQFSWRQLQNGASTQNHMPYSLQYILISWKAHMRFFMQCSQSYGTEDEVAYGRSWKRSARERRNTLLAIFASCVRLASQPRPYHEPDAQSRPQTTRYRCPCRFGTSLGRPTLAATHTSDVEWRPESEVILRSSNMCTDLFRPFKIHEKFSYSIIAART